MSVAARANAFRADWSAYAPPAPTFLGRRTLANVDLAMAGATVAYVVDDVPPRAEDYFLIAFLDDNGNVDQSNPDAAGPDRGDLVSLMGVSAPKVTLATAGDHTHDIDLNLVMPF